MSCVASGHEEQSLVTAGDSDERLGLEGEGVLAGSQDRAGVGLVRDAFSSPLLPRRQAAESGLAGNW